MVKPKFLLGVGTIVFNGYEQQNLEYKFLFQDSPFLLFHFFRMSGLARIRK